MVNQITRSSPCFARRPNVQICYAVSDANRAGRSTNQRCASRSETILFASSAGVSLRGPTLKGELAQSVQVHDRSPEPALSAPVSPSRS